MPEPQRHCPKCGAAYGAAVMFCPADGAPLSARPLAQAKLWLGRKLPPDLELTELIGVGAMASVYRARQAGVERDVAVKILHPELSRNETLVARFRREARAAARIRHPNVIEVHALGDAADLESGVGPLPYLVFEHLDGLSLRSLLAASGGAISAARALHVALQVADAIGEAHELSIVHRDLKPENLMLVRRGDDPDFVKVLDFGLSRFSEAERAIETHAGAVLGTARYVSPEGARGETVDARADVYAVATILFECLAGRTPFEGDNAVKVLVKQASEPAPDVREFEATRGTPGPLAELIARCLSKDRERRPANGRALGRALARAAAESGLGPRELAPRPTLFGTRGLRPSALQATQVLGSAELPRGDASELAGFAPLSPDPLRPDDRVPAVPGEHAYGAPSAAGRSPHLRRFALLAACFVLGASGALGVGSHFGACGR